MFKINLRLSHALLLIIVLLLLPNLGRAELDEREMLKNSPAYGDFHKAKKIKKEGQATLKVWDKYLEHAGQAPPAEGQALKGPVKLAVEYDEIWVVEREEKKAEKGKPDLYKLYWQGDNVQAYTREKFFSLTPGTDAKLKDPGYRLIHIADRQAIIQKLARQAALEEAFNNLTPAQHLAEAKKALAEGNPEAEDPKKRSFGRVQDARKHLEAIKRDAEEYGEARELLKEVAHREKEVKKLNVYTETATREFLIKRREEAAKALEKDFLDKGMDVRTTLSGPDKTTLRMEYILFSRPMVHVLVTRSEMLSDLKEKGFLKVIFSNKKMKFHQDYDLDRE